MRNIIKKIVGIITILAVVTAFYGCADSVFEKATIEVQEESVLEKATIEVKETFADQIAINPVIGFNGKKIRNIYLTVGFIDGSNINMKNLSLYKMRGKVLTILKAGLIGKCATNLEEAKDIMDKTSIITKNLEKKFVWFNNSEYTYCILNITDVSNKDKSLVGFAIVEGKSKEEIEKSINDPEFGSFLKSVMNNE